MVHTAARSARADVYSCITDEIVAAVEKGAGDWRMPWHHDGGSIARPRNVASDKPYRGINILALWVAATRSGYAGGTWRTYRQWAERGCQVRRGETATTVVFWKTIDGRHTTGVDTDPLDPDEGGTRLRFLARGYFVFNEAQVDGTTPRELPRLPESERIARADAFFAALKIPIVFEGSEACCRPYIDTVFMPPFERFVDAASFYSTLCHECSHAVGAAHRLGEIETALEAFERRPVLHDAAEMARAGAFVSIDGTGGLRIERGYVRPGDEAPVAPAEEEGEHESADVNGAPGTFGSGAKGPLGPSAHPEDPVAEADEDDGGVRPLSDRLMTELTAHRTLALREAVANDPDTAFLAMLHALCLRLFYRFGLDTCLEVEAKSVLFGTQIEGLGDMAYATAIDARHGTWAAQLPKDTAALWDVLAGLDGDSRQALFAHCVGLTVNATYQPYDRRPKAIAHADRVAEAVQLDMATSGWRPTVAGYLGRVTKARILEAVCEAKGGQAAQLIEDLRKADMAREADRLLEGSGWLPEPLRLRGTAGAAADAETLPAFLASGGDDEPRAVAAE